MHNIQSVRTLMFLENKGEGCNLTIQVLDGIMCHNGEKLLNKYTYENKSVEDFINQYNNSYTDKSYSNNLIPMTLEACVVRISDIIGYIGRDLDDAFLVNQLNENIIPSEIKNVLGINNREIVNNLILDIINNSYGKNYITMSDDAFNSLNELIRFNYDNIYLKANTKEEVLEYELMFSTVFDKCIYILENNLTEYNIFIDYLNRMNDYYRNCNSNTRIVLDFIAGMTDSYFVNEFEILKKI